MVGAVAGAVLSAALGLTLTQAVTAINCYINMSSDYDDVKEYYEIIKLYGKKYKYVITGLFLSLCVFSVLMIVQIKRNQYNFNSKNGIAYQENSVDVDNIIDEREQIYVEQCNRECVIAIIDTAVDFSRISSEYIWKNRNEIQYDGIDNDKNGYIDDKYGWNFVEGRHFDENQKISSEHGTFIAGLLFTKTEHFVGVLNESLCKIMCLQTLNNSNAEGDMQDVIEAIEYAEKNNANICLLSLASYNDNIKLYEHIRNSKMLYVRMLQRVMT